MFKARTLADIDNMAGHGSPCSLVVAVIVDNLQRSMSSISRRNKKLARAEVQLERAPFVSRGGLSAM